MFFIESTWIDEEIEETLIVCEDSVDRFNMLPHGKWTLKTSFEYCDIS